MPLQDGDVIEFDYELWIDGRDALYDTTLRQAAEAAGILEPDAFYAPMTYVVGSSRIIPGLEEALRVADMGQATTVTIPVEKAYGPRDTKLIETVPIQEFKKNDVDPQVGLRVSYKNRRGLVTTVGGGRVRVDFNPPLVGKALKYRFTVRRVAKDDAERVAGLLRMNFPANVDWRAKLSREEGVTTVTVETPEPVLFHQNWPLAKLRALMDVRRYTQVERVRFIESYPLPRGEGPQASGPVAQPEAR